jgi:hypothetical protein
MSNHIVVRVVKTWHDRRRFQRLPWAIYAQPGVPRDPNWVPPILSQERELFGWPSWWGHRHPFYDEAEVITLLAERGGKTLGRLAVLVNHVHNRKYAENIV